MPGMLLAMLALPAAAGSVYKCDSGDGVTAYTNKKVPGASCSLVGSYKPKPASKPKAVAAPKPVSPAPAPPKPQETASQAPAPALAVAAAEPPKPAAVPAAQPVAASSGPRVVRGEVYAYVGRDGVKTYTSRRPSGVSASAIRTIKYSYIETCYACSAAPGVNFGNVRLNMTAYQDEIASAAQEFGVDEAIVRAIIHAESAFNPNALSRAGAQGLMQLMPATARRFGVGDAFNAGQNIRGGVQYLSWLLKRFNGDLKLAAAGYNAGEGAVDKYGGVPPYGETQRYVQRVGVLADRYRGSIASAR